MSDVVERGIRRLKDSIVAVQTSIGSINQAIAEQRKIVEDYEKLLRDGNGRYSKEGLIHGIERAQGHIERLKQVKLGERDRIKKFMGMITDIEEARRLQESVIVHIEFEGESDDDSAH
jgi:hypothetical protein